ncbi:unnamed protein product [Adineta steineri]|uniref:G-protein coupled receptors family 1 profile domain-containing protein n=2 Tax=Adineta steineri TaxID=433720 RepID=A0A818NRD3_9BILA|nr:unnamed protein product [Adineta steineri]
MSSAIIDFINKLNVATMWMNQIIPLLQIIFGTFGNLFNIIIFTRRTLRTNPCSIYFLASSINNFLVLYVVLIPHYLAAKWNLDASTTNNVLCKLRNICQYLPFCLVLWFPVLASIDRFLSSSRQVRYRRWSSLPIAKKVIICTIIFFLLIHLHLVVFYESAWNGRAFVCALLSYEYFVFWSFFGPIVACLLPIIFMCIFGVLMIVNVRSVQNRVVPQGGVVGNERTRSNDRQLIIMLLFQVLTILLISIPYVAVNTYNAVVLVMLNYRLSQTGEAIFNFAYQFCSSLYYTNPVIGFYIYTLTGPRFRVEMKRCTQVGLNSALTTTGLTQYLSERNRRILLGDNQNRH